MKKSEMIRIFKEKSVLFSVALLSILMQACNVVEKEIEITTIKIIPDTLYIDRLKIGDSIKISFLVRNIGENKLKIKNVSPACNCTVASFDSSKIDKGKETSINIIYRNLADTGRIHKVFILDANTKEGLTPLILMTKKIYK